RSAQSALWGIPVDIFAGSLSSTTDVDKALEGIDTVYHLARAEGDTWQEYYEQDVLVTKNIAERCLKKGVKRFFYTGTIDSYYSALAENTITELTPLDPDIETRNLYARSKASCEQLLTRMCERDGLPLTIFRPGVVIGEGCSPFHWGVGMWHSETRMQFWGEGNTKLPLVLVEDVAEALVNALDASDIKGKSFNLIADPCLTGQEYIEACSQLSGTKIRAQTGSIRLFYLDDLVKNIIKYAIKHPKRKMPSYNDWDSRAHRAYYDCHATKEALSWNPVSDKEKIIEEGIAKPLSEA
ncbi:MAG: NAD(P)-dependent oxidoreductase, partial [Methylococcales bacterium]|nr:NAD(P)-dependent oxidoreductase [Methylococcales bacterium]